MPSVLRRIGRFALLQAGLLTAGATELVELQGRQLHAAISPRGATLESVVFKGRAFNPLLSAESAGPNKAHGHFLCFDRWGRISEAEKAQGYMFHGEARHRTWQVLTAETGRATLRTTLPTSRLTMERTYAVSSSDPVLTITSLVINRTQIVRPYNLVEHALLAPLWLGPAVRLHSNAAAGHLHLAGTPLPNSEFDWPRAVAQETEFDLGGNPQTEPDLMASVVFPADSLYAWALLHDPVSATAFALVWPCADFPWLNLWWRGSHASKAARAVEPGTTGLHGPMEACIERGPLLGNALHVELRPGETRRHRLHYVLLPALAAGAEFLDAVVINETFRVRWETARGPIVQAIPLPADA